MPKKAYIADYYSSEELKKSILLALIQWKQEGGICSGKYLQDGQSKRVQWR